MSYIQLNGSSAAEYLAQRGYVLSSPEQAQALGLAPSSSALNLNLITSPSSTSLAFAAPTTTLLQPAQAAPTLSRLSPAPVAAPVAVPRLCPCGCGYEIRDSPVVFTDQAPLAVDAAPVARLATPVARLATPVAAVAAPTPAPVALAEPVALASPQYIYASEQNLAPPLAFADTPAPVQAVVAPTPLVGAALPAPEALVAVEAAPAPSQAPCPLKSLPPLPPVNASCYAPPAVEPGLITAKQIQLPTEERVLETNDADVQTVVRENNSYTTFNRTVVTTVNRNHLHTQRVVTNENNFNTHVTNNVVRVNDIHRQQVEQIAGETRVKNDFKETTTVEQPRCLNASGNSLLPCGGRY